MARKRGARTVVAPVAAAYDLGIAATMKEHPHFMMPEGWIEIVEIMPVPGM